VYQSSSLISPRSSSGCCGRPLRSAYVVERLAEELKKIRDQQDDLTGPRLMESLLEGAKLGAVDDRPEPIAQVMNDVLRPLG
jgi:hypothetical protein